MDENTEHREGEIYNKHEVACLSPPEEKRKAARVGHFSSALLPSLTVENTSKYSLQGTNDTS